MAILSSLRRRHTLLLPHLLRPFSSIPEPLTASAAKSRLRKEYDPDKALSILASVSPSSPSSTPASNRHAIDLAVRRLAKARRFVDIESLLESRKATHPNSSDEPFLTTIILAYGSAGMLNRALQTFESDIPNPTALSFNALLSAAIRAKQHRRVPKLFAELSEKRSVTPDHVSYGILVKALCLSAKSDKAIEMLKEMEAKGIQPTSVIFNTLIDSFFKKGKPEAAEELWKEMRTKGCEPDLATYNVRVMGKASNGKPEEVIELIGEIEAAGLKPDVITYNYLITCYCKNGRFEEAMGVYRSLKEKGCEPNAATFKYFLQFLCEKGDFDGGWEVCLGSMRWNRIPEFKVMRPLVEGLVKGGKLEEAKKVVGVVKERFPENLLGGWRKLEKELGLSVEGEVPGLNVDGEAAEQVEAA